MRNEYHWIVELGGGEACRRNCSGTLLFVGNAKNAKFPPTYGYLLLRRKIKGLGVLYLTVTRSRVFCDDDLMERRTAFSETFVLRLGGKEIEAVAGEILVHPIMTEHSISQTVFLRWHFI